MVLFLGSWPMIRCWVVQPGNMYRSHSNYYLSLNSYVCPTAVCYVLCPSAGWGSLFCPRRGLVWESFFRSAGAVPRSMKGRNQEPSGGATALTPAYCWRVGPGNTGPHGLQAKIRKTTALKYARSTLQQLEFIGNSLHTFIQDSGHYFKNL